MDTNEKRNESRTSMVTVKKLKLGGAAALGLVVLIVAFQNLNPLKVRLLFWDASIPGVVLLPFVFLLGMVAGYVLRRKGRAKAAARVNGKSAQSG